MPSKTNHAYSTTISGSAGATPSEVGTSNNQHRRTLAASAFTGGALALVLFLALASLGINAQRGAGAEKSYIRALAYIRN